MDRLHRQSQRVAARQRSPRPVHSKNSTANSKTNSTPDNTTKPEKIGADDYVVQHGGTREAVDDAKREPFTPRADPRSAKVLRQVLILLEPVFEGISRIDLDSVLRRVVAIPKGRRRAHP